MKDSGRQAEADRAQLVSVRAAAAEDAEHRKGSAEDDSGGGDGRAGPRDRAQDGIAQRHVVSLLANAGHHENVVVLSEREQEDEHQEGQDEDKPLFAAERYEDERRETERGKVGEDDAHDQIERRDHRAQNERQQDRDRGGRDRYDQLEVVVGCCRDVVERRRLARNPARGGARGARRGAHDAADAWGGVERLR
jgi:hypothetical protein